MFTNATSLAGHPRLLPEATVFWRSLEFVNFEDSLSSTFMKFEDIWQPLEWEKAGGYMWWVHVGTKLLKNTALHVES